MKDKQKRQKNERYIPLDKLVTGDITRRLQFAAELRRGDE